MTADPNRYAHPTPGVAARLFESLANSTALAALRRATAGRLPFAVLASDVVNVVYATWLVDAARAAPWMPPGGELWAHDGLTPFTILTYRHGHFGPSLAGPLRALFPSPLQSNWRFYLRAPLAGMPKGATVVFVKNVLDSPLYALGTRVFSDALPSHLARAFALSVEPAAFSIGIEPGAGSAPRFAARFERGGAPSLGRDSEASLPEAFAPFAPTWTDAVATLSSQDAAVALVPSIGRVAMATIDLPVDVARVEPLRLAPGSLDCPLLDTLGARGEPLCYHLPAVRFRALSEKLL